MKTHARFIAVSRKTFGALGWVALVLMLAMAVVVAMMFAGWSPPAALDGILLYVCFYSVIPTGVAAWLLLYYSRRLV
jgi:hypothetical protein